MKRMRLAGRIRRSPRLRATATPRAARVLAKNDKISMKELADRAFMSESTAARSLEAWRACVAALIEAGRLPDPAKKKAPPKARPVPVAKPAAAETVGTAAI